MVDNNKVKKIIFGRIPTTKCGNILFDILFDDYSPSGYFLLFGQQKIIMCQ